MSAKNSFEDTYVHYPFAPLVGVGIALSQVLTRRLDAPASRPATDKSAKAAA